MTRYINSYFLLQIFALNTQGSQIFKESALLNKTPDKCQNLHIILGVTLSVLLVALLALLIGILYFCRKEPVQRLQVLDIFTIFKIRFVIGMNLFVILHVQRVRSRVYSRL